MQTRYPDVSEDQYRSHYLNADIAQCRRVVMVVMWVTLPFIYFDFASRQPWNLFLTLTAARAAVFFYSLWLVRQLPQMLKAQQLDRQMLRWVWLALAVTLAGNAAQPAGYFGHYYIDIWIVAMYFVVLPLPLRLLNPPLVGFVAASLSILFLYKQAPALSYTYNVALMLLLAAVSGHTISSRTHRFRRKTLSAEQELERQASTDPLTGVANRREFMRISDDELKRHARLGKSLSLLVLDLDHFPQINEAHGYQAGEIVLVEVTRRLKRATRSYDCLARYGGEEFCVLLPEASAEDAGKIAARTKATIVAMPVAVSGKELRVSATIGVATMLTGDSVVSILKRADAELHRAKKQGAENQNAPVPEADRVV
ncbi:GGDEF domain-containing protein [Undibacterium sp.]|jgi:diguanylate cyclase (GGDEF)-like protein|uniref:GGDEF domain-containing protein n=1 Tax=Undibacterium sp. TaxID=1914977 RepID=UPI002BBC92FE|nr:GGDEF domain-containing protein [Undibacterium sp.]HTD02314.1 GGDEF domain-containing protein [Undibacterium sp.]